MTAFIDHFVASSSLDILHVDMLGIDSAQCSYVKVLVTKLAIDCS
jgi:Holliday junction resolvasome RuvABC ATP-dependent DNA helicase subunit